MAVQNRRGLKKDFVPSKMLPSEWAVSIDQETENQIVWMCFSPGVVKRMGTYEDFEQQIAEATDDIRERYEETFNEIKTYMEGLESATEGYKNTAVTKAGEAASSANSAAGSASTAMQKASDASNSADDAEDFSLKSKSYAVGTDGQIRPNDNSDCAKHYYEQCRNISGGISGALKPMGTVAFSQLPSLSLASAGDMYNISDEFVTTFSFKEGTGHKQPAGANVYKTADGFWDCLAGTMPTELKNPYALTFTGGVTGSYDGSAAKTVAIPSIASDIGSVPYNIVENGDFNNITTPGIYTMMGTSIANAPASGNDFGLIVLNSNSDGGSYVQQIATKKGKPEIYVRYGGPSSWGNWTRLLKVGDTGDDTVTFTSADVLSPTAWADIPLVSSGVTNKSLWNKFSTAVKNIRYLYKMLGNTDISAIGDGTVTGILSGLKTKTINITSSYTQTGAISCDYNILTVSIYVALLQNTHYGAETVIGTLPDNLRPNKNIRYDYRSPTNLMYRFTIRTDGAISCYKYTNAEDTNVFVNLTFLRE